MGKRDWQSGFSLIELMVTVAVFSFVAFSIISLNAQMKLQQTQTSGVVPLDLYRRNLAAVILSSDSWTNTVKANSNAGLATPSGAIRYSSTMECLASGTACPNQASPFALLDSGANVVFNSLNQQNGITEFGLACSSDCPYRYDLRWKPICPPSGPCIPSQITVEAVLIINPALQNNGLPKINPDRYGLTPPITRSAN